MKNKITIVTPVYNDWKCVDHLIKDISTTLDGKVEAIHLIAVNDCSTELPSGMLNIPQNIDYSQLDLVTNVGHQRAILIGLCYCLEQQIDSSHIIVLDSDGEDDPKYINQFLERSNASDQDQIIFAKRSKRSESWTFKLFYFFYTRLFKLLTGSSISFGNFSCIPISLLPRICNQSSFWNHYSASVLNSKMPFSLISTERRKRYFGSSKMNFDNLILHGLSSLSVHIESIIIRALKLSFIVLIIILLIITIVVLVKYLTDLAIPGWATNVFGFTLNSMITVVLFNLLIILTHLNSRNKPLSKPYDFYKTYISNKTEA